MSVEPEGPKTLSIWFFCGILMLGYGLVLIATGLIEYLTPVSNPWPWLLGQKTATVLANLQPTLWWGMVLTLFGGFYTIRFRPGKG